MRPLRLDLAGFGSFVESASLDFSDVELFAITGSTGSGKTTLLDAITFALYGETPRMGRRGLKALLSPGVDKAAVQLTFALAEEVWRVTRVIGAKSEARLEKQDGSSWRLSAASEKIKTLNEAVEKLLGLDYNAFTRAILLPQGRFDTFLKGDSRERRELLFSLYGLEALAQLRERAVARLTDLREKLAAAQTLSDHYQGVNEEALSEVRDEAEEAARERRRLDGLIEGLEREINKLSGSLDMWQEKDRLESRKQALAQEEESMREVRRWVELAEAAGRALPEVQRLRRAQAQARQAELEFEKSNSAYEKAKEEWEKKGKIFNEDDLESLRNRVAALPLFEARLRKLNMLGGDAGAGEVLHYDEERYRETEKELLRAKEQRRLTEERRRLQKRREGLLADLRDVGQLLEEEQQKLQKLTADGKEAAEELAELKRRLQEERSRAELGSFHHLLREGEECPLCGQVVAKLPPRRQSPLAGLEKAVRQKDEEVALLRRRWSEAAAEVRGLQSKKGQLQRQLADVEQDIVRLGAADSEGKSNEAEIAERLLAMRRGLARELREQAQGEEPSRYPRSLRQKLSRLEKERAIVAELERRLQKAEADARAARVIFETQRAALKPLRASVTALLDELGFSSAEEAEKAARSPQEVESLKKRLDEWRNEVAYVGKRLQELEGELSGQRKVDPAEITRKKQELQTRQRQREALDKRLGHLEERVRRLEKDLEAKRKAQAQAAALVQETGIWEQLAEDLKGHKFPDYLLERLQLDMLARASELLFTLSQQRYRLLLREGAYFVEDLWTGAVRPAKTLSGGETFLASLSLALSLSEHLSRGRLGALFLDEGFGTLDAEALELAAEVLESLPTQGRMVGVVTHVPELAQRIPTRLLVEKTPQGSRARWDD